MLSSASWLVLLSVVLGIEGAFVGFNLTAEVGVAIGARRRLLLAGAALAFAAAIWSLNFTITLAQGSAHYLILPMLLSFAVGALAAGAAVEAVSGGVLTPARLAASSGFMAAAMVAVRYVGMTASQAQVVGSPLSATGSVVIALVGSALTFKLSGSYRNLLSAIVFGLAAAATHHAAEAGLAFVPPPAMSAPTMSSDVLAIVIAGVGFGLTGLFLLLLSPERPQAAPAAAPAARTERVEGPAVSASPPPAAGDATLRRGIYAPLGGAGAPPQRAAEHLPFEHEGGTHFVPVDQVVAVQANAHYTFLYNGSAKLFCPLAIGEVESRLDRSRFMRVHRSHIVNIARVVCYKRSGDSETVELAGDGPYSVPVSRSRAGWLKSRIGNKMGQSG